MDFITVTDSQLRLAFRIHFSIVFAVFASLVCTSSQAADETAKRPNVLMIAIDDLNDWIEPLGGHPQVKTPAMAKLAARGVTFTNAHCQAPLCNPSRTSIMTGRRPTSTGIYGLSPWIRKVDELADLTTMPQHFHGTATKHCSVEKFITEGMVADAGRKKKRMFGDRRQKLARDRNKS